MVRKMIEDEMEGMEGMEQPEARDVETQDVASTSPLNVIDVSKYTNPSTVETAEIALEYETRRRVEAQMQVRYGALGYRARNEVLGSVLGTVEEGLRAVQGDIGMLNRERKGAGGGEVGAELGRMGREWTELVGKVRRLEEAVRGLETEG